MARGSDQTGTSFAARFARAAVVEAAIRPAPLTVISVHPAREEVDKTLAQLGVPGPETVTVQGVSGFPAEVLITAGRDADMLVVGSRGSGGFSRLLLGSVSSQVTHHAQCPVVVIPSGDRS